MPDTFSGEFLGGTTRLVCFSSFLWSCAGEVHLVSSPNLRYASTISTPRQRVPRAIDLLVLVDLRRVAQWHVGVTVPLAPSFSLPIVLGSYILSTRRSSIILSGPDLSRCLELVTNVILSRVRFNWLYAQTYRRFEAVVR